ncbi:transcriptional regulator, ArsR family [Dethiosulfatibacter aminovorans DSM 17477]|uniref:Transcriptional regulator, ArsR family n=1 Tax=Dethiosulfatibacter aminovorans DSM 17477 TaxID=1121476 RepID=A0A1M6AY13_9FIRM|nr:metalloregulator ArsR/SmtB family transcription factor [Dethiosulfatibacter aminovorans]SHI41208.1 transcriptional regulator, ArsR family [Dethiosulfatibacter aminovorans DSM 17477]
MIDIFKALGDENRMRLVNLLIHAELCVCEIEVMLDLNQSNISRHLKKLKDAGIISSSKDAQWIHYKISDKFINENGLLYNYLELEMQKDKILQGDLNRYMKYKNSNLNCQYIREDKDMVLEMIR